MERSSLAIRFMKMIGLIASAYLLFASINYPFRVHSDRIALTLILTVICLASYLWIGKKMAKLTLKQNEIILLMVMSGIVLLEVHIAFKMRLLPTVDLSHIIDEAGYLLDEGLHEFTDQAYFGSCTNNIPLGILIYWVFKTGRVIGANDDLLTGGLWNVLLLLWMYVNAYRILIRVTKKETAIYVMLFVLANPVCIAYASYYYTDTVSMAFAVAGLSHMVWGLSEDTKFKRLHLVLGGFLLAFATKVRVTSCFIIISIVLTLVIYRKLKAFIRSIVFCVIGALIFSIIWIPLYHYHIPFETRDTEIPVTHYLMMGANKETSGTYFGPDVDFTKSFSTKEERIQATKEVWINRIRTNGILGNIRLILAKEENVWTEGEKNYERYTWQTTGDSHIKHFLVGDKAALFKSYMQAYNNALFLFILLGIIISWKRYSEVETALLIYFLGALLFYVFWESHPRQSVSYEIILVGMFLPVAEHWVSEKRADN